MNRFKALSLNKNLSPNQQRTQRERMWVVFTALVIITAWIIGHFSKDTNALDYAVSVLPGAVEIENRGSYFIGISEAGDVIGYAAVGQGNGYGGPLKVIVGVDSVGNILGMEIIENHETPGFFRRVGSTGFLEQFDDKTIRDPMRIDNDIDGISGATLTVEAIATSIRQSVRTIARESLDVTLPPEKKSIKFGIPEVVLIGLFAAGYYSHKQRNPKIKLRLRWGTLLTGMVVLGFIYTAPLTISQVIAFLSGYWPDWHNNLYWYILIGGIIFATTLDAKNPYCSWFCPFGAFQEVVSKITNAKIYRPRGWKRFLQWLPRVLALTAIVLGLAFRQPGLAGYEPFATLFDLRGTTLEWILLLITILASLIFYRPFCNFICPIDPVVDYIGAVRRWVKKWII
jgi:polyferredoxin